MKPLCPHWYLSVDEIDESIKRWQNYLERFPTNKKAIEKQLRYLKRLRTKRLADINRKGDKVG